jgi:HD-GYP domain-containing protein (c-di-GMP phosphodiesterase class II)
MAIPDPSERGSEDLLALWSDLESAVSMLLHHPLRIQDFPWKLQRFAAWLQDLLTSEVDAGLYLLFQLTATSAARYSASHAVICAALCEVVAPRLRLPDEERSALVQAALAMNIGMTDLQDALALQMAPPSVAQRQQITTHAAGSVALLEQVGVTNRLLLDTVRLHHVSAVGRGALQTLPPPARLAHLLHTVDRYAALVSPRITREGRSPLDSARAILQARAGLEDAAGAVLVSTVGLFPPGTLVELDSGDTAVVVRRGLGSAPLVAVVRDSAGRPVHPPRLHDVAVAPPGIRRAVVARLAAPQLDQRQWLQVGVIARKDLAEREALLKTRRARPPG